MARLELWYLWVYWKTCFTISYDMSVLCLIFVILFSLFPSIFLRFFLVLWIISIEVQRLTSSFGICEIELFQFFKHLVCPFWLAEVLWIIYFYGCTMYIVVNNTIHYLQKPNLYVCNCALDNKCFLIKRWQNIDRSLGPNSPAPNGRTVR